MHLPMRERSCSLVESVLASRVSPKVRRATWAGEHERVRSEARSSIYDVECHCRQHQLPACSLLSPITIWHRPNTVRRDFIPSHRRNFLAPLASEKQQLHQVAKRTFRLAPNESDFVITENAVTRTLPC